MIIAVPREVAAGERRIALVPEAVIRLVGAGHTVWVEAGAPGSDFPDGEFEEAGARIVHEVQQLYEGADLVVKVRAPMEHPGTGKHEVDMLREGSRLIAILEPYLRHDLVRRLAAKGVTSFALDLMPRTTLAQDKDVLSSMSTISGYKAVLLAANDLPRLMPMLMTAAGTVKPARVLVIGVGVAGLQAIATARRLGAVVAAFDIRPAVREQVASLGARFVAEEAIAQDAEQASGYARGQTAAEGQRQHELLTKHIADSDVVICSALVPGRQAPVLVSRDQVEKMPARLRDHRPGGRPGRELRAHGGRPGHRTRRRSCARPRERRQLRARGLEPHVCPQRAELRGCTYSRANRSSSTSTTS